MLDFLEKLLYMLIFVAFFYGFCALIQFTLVRPKTRYVVIGLFGTVGALITLLGLLSLAAPAVVTPRLGRFLLVLGAVTLLPLVKSVRYLFARLTPFDPLSTVDISGLIVFLWSLTIAGTILFTIDVTQLVSKVSVTLSDALINVIAFPLLALSLIGIFVTRDWPQSVARLGLGRLTPRQIAVAFGLVGPILVVAIGTDYVGQALQPDVYAEVQAVFKAMSSNISNPLVAALIGLSAGVGEETFFRGAIQPRFGIVLTALAFAAIHILYGPSFAVGGVFLTGIILGYERKYLNTTACIITHAAYNTIAFLINAAS